MNNYMQCRMMLYFAIVWDIKFFILMYIPFFFKTRILPI